MDYRLGEFVAVNRARLLALEDVSRYLDAMLENMKKKVLKI